MAVGDDAPPFWWRDNPWQGWALYPASLVYGFVSARRMEQKPDLELDAPVICVGNFIVGGAGKTPTVEMLVRSAKGRGLKPGVLTRGYGGAIGSATVVKPEKHNSHDVGDEALLHADIAPTVVSAYRPDGARLLREQNCDLVIMDDGFQNPTLHKDFSLAVISAKRGLGNGFSIPAGPLRAPLNHQIRKMDALFAIGEEGKADAIIRKSARAGKPVYRATMEAASPRKWRDGKYVAYAAIGDPGKFFETLTKSGAEIVGQMEFGDHHVFSEAECIELLRLAQKEKAKLVTTTKDAARLRSRDQTSLRLLEETEIFEARMVPDDPEMARKIIDKALRRFEKRR